MDVTLRKKIITAFKLNGFSLRSDACKFLVEQLYPINQNEHEKWLDQITEYLQKSLKSTVVEQTNVEIAIKECLRKGFDETETILNVISAFEVPEFDYDVERKKFVNVNSKSGKSCPLFDVPRSKAHMYNKRYSLLHQSVSRNPLFSPAIMGSSNSGQKYQLRPVEYLLSTSGKISGAVVLGMVTQLKEGKYFLEDPTGVIEMDLTSARYHTGLYTENCFVLAEGWYEDKVFHINGIGFPPPEPSSNSRAFFGTVNTFGGPSTVSLKNSKKLQEYEKENEGAVFVFLSDVWLDNLKVMDKLQVLFMGYEEFPPIAFVFMGNFLSSQTAGSQTQILQSKFKALSDVLLRTPALVNKSKFIFVPGPSDPAMANILPRSGLPNCITEDFRSKIPSAIFTTNPCRIQYCTQEIVVIRENLVTKLCRNSIHFPTSGEIHDHFAKTIMCQATLVPLPLTVCPVYWSFMSSLNLYPLPDMIVVADQFNSFTTSHMDCIVMNPGSFPKSEFSFKTYDPAVKQVEDSQIPSE